MSRSKKFLVPAIIVIFFILIFFLIKIFSRTIYNDDNAYGNTAGNLFNGGLYSELNGKIYFSNTNDDGALYRMDLDGTNFKMLYSDKVGYINAIGHYIYYVRMNNAKQNSSSNIFNFNNVGIYRTNLNGSGLKMLYDNPSGLLNVHGNSVYYQHYNKEDGLNFYSVNIDGSEEKMISRDAIMPISIVDNSLYYAGTEDDHNIYTMDLKTEQNATIYTGNCYAPIVNNKSIFYMSLADNYAIYRMNLDGSDPTPVVNERCSTFNITSDGGYLYYQVDDNKNNRICIMNVTTGDSDTIREGNYKQIHITSNFMFFTDFSDELTYYMPVGSSDNISTFNPPNLSK